MNVKKLAAYTMLAAVPYVASAAFLSEVEQASGRATVEQKGKQVVLRNQAVAFRVGVDAQGKLSDLQFQTFKPQAEVYALGDAFRLGIADAAGTAGFLGTNLTAGDFRLVGAPKIEKLASQKGVRTAEQFAGVRVSYTLSHAATGVSVRWSVELRDGSHYVRTNLEVLADKGLLTGVQVLDLRVKNAKQIGTAVAGNPIATEHLFMGLELPMGRADLQPEEVKIGLECKLPLEKGKPYRFSSVIGTYRPQQLRRDFLAYLEREKASTTKPFLHYNGWFDFDRFVTEDGMLKTIDAYGREFIEQRGVKVKAFVIDDGWDDWDHEFWGINRTKFPSGFKKVGEHLQRVGSHFGIWISPLAGYDNADKRIALAAKQGLTRNGTQSLDLSYAPYYKWFLDKCTQLIREDQTMYFKFDKAGNGVNPHFLALLQLCDQLRLVNPQLVINITVGTWPSPFWLNSIDCTWREGNDMGYEGPGDNRERWITYRDAQTWRGVVSKAPLYPLSSIMTHGIVLSDGHPLPRKALEGGKNMKHEARSFFGSGTIMQELYVKPDLCTPEVWDTLAEAAKWGQANAAILTDVHWIGGNPSGGKEVYGWAAWKPQKGIVTLRNPSDQTMTYSLDVGAAFELPASGAKKYTVKSAYADVASPIQQATAGKADVISLKPFEVLVLEFTPSGK